MDTVAVSVVLFHSMLIFTLYGRLYIGIQFSFYFTLQFVVIDLLLPALILVHDFLLPDIDECTRTMPCDHICHNQPGSFVCECNTGYELQGTVTCIGEHCIVVMI